MSITTDVDANVNGNKEESPGAKGKEVPQTYYQRGLKLARAGVER